MRPKGACKEIQLHLADFAENNLSEEDMSTIRNHLDSCPICSEELNKFNKLWKLLDMYSDIQPQHNYALKVFNKLKNSNSPQKRKFKLTYIAIAASVLLIILTSIFINLRSNNNISSPQHYKSVDNINEVVDNMDVIETVNALVEMDDEDIEFLASLSDEDIELLDYLLVDSSTSPNEEN